MNSHVRLWMNIMPEMESDEILRVKLEVLKRDHRTLDEELAELNEGARGNTLLIKRMKRQKLLLKDQISSIENRLTPDIIA